MKMINKLDVKRGDEEREYMKKEKDRKKLSQDRSRSRKKLYRSDQYFGNADNKLAKIADCLGKLSSTEM